MPTVEEIIAKKKARTPAPPDASAAASPESGGRTIAKSIIAPPGGAAATPLSGRNAALNRLYPGGAQPLQSPVPVPGQSPVPANANPIPAATPAPTIGQAVANAVLAGPRIVGGAANLATGVAKDVGKDALALVTGNNPTTRPDGAFTDTQQAAGQIADAVVPKVVSAANTVNRAARAVQAFGGNVTGAKPFAAAPISRAGNTFTDQGGGTPVRPTISTVIPEYLRNPDASPVAATPKVAPQVQQEVPQETQGQPAPQAPSADAVPGVYRNGNSFSDRPADGKAFTPTRGSVAQDLDGTGRQNIADALKFYQGEDLRRQAAVDRRSAEAQAGLENSRNNEVREQLLSQLRSTPPSDAQRSRGFRPRAGSDPRTQLVSQIAALNKVVAPEKTPSEADALKSAAEIQALNADSDAKTKNADTQQQAAQLAVQADQRKSEVQKRISDLLSDPNATPEQITQAASISAALQGNPLQQQKFQIATQDEPVMSIGNDGKPFDTGALKKTAYVIDAAGNARAVGGTAAGGGQQIATAPDAAVQKLLANPALAKDFDAKYGVGASARYLK